MIRLYTPTSGHGSRLIEWHYAGLMIAWGAFLLLPMDTFAGPEYALIAGMAAENTWAAVAIGIGAMRCFMLAINGNWRRTPAFRLLGSIIGVMWWSGLGYLIVSGPEHHIPAGVVYYPVFVAFEVVSCWRGAVDAFHSGAFRKGPVAR